MDPKSTHGTAVQDPCGEGSPESTPTREDVLEAERDEYVNHTYTACSD